MPFDSLFFPFPERWIPAKKDHPACFTDGFVESREDAHGQRRFLLQGSKAQIMSAKSAIEQRVAVVLGVKMAEKAGLVDR